MDESRIETTTGMCVVALTKYLMKKQNLDYEKAYKKLLGMELYKLLLDIETRLFLETNEYLCEACDRELEEGVDVLYKFINS
ncbi:MAG TPA: hypothetical protein DCZ91_26315 [Lachnospiraceae bacterium]|nr:hypothetical protein [Lachnospiraceae bacterium]